MRWSPVLGFLSVALAITRYLMQGSGNVWTRADMRFYVSDSVVGWVQTEAGWLWLGLDVVGLLVGVTVGTWVALRVARLVAAKQGIGPRWGRLTKGLAGLGAVVCLLTPIAPLVAFADGLPPEGARAALSLDKTDDIGFRMGNGFSEGQAGAYIVWSGSKDVNLVVADIAAGEETFQARFGPVSGGARFDPKRLDLGVALTISVPAGSLDSGVSLRDKHSRADLLATEHPELALTLAKLDEQRVHESGSRVRFQAGAVLSVMGRDVKVSTSGTVRVLSPAERKKLGVVSPTAYLVAATGSVPLGLTPLDVKNFDRDTIELTARFILIPKD